MSSGSRLQARLDPVKPKAMETNQLSKNVFLKGYIVKNYSDFDRSAAINDVCPRAKGRVMWQISQKKGSQKNKNQQC